MFIVHSVKPECMEEYLKEWYVSVFAFHRLCKWQCISSKVKQLFMLCLTNVFSSSFVKLMHDKKTGAELAGGWTTEIGEQDEAGMYFIYHLFIL